MVRRQGRVHSRLAVQRSQGNLRFIRPADEDVPQGFGIEREVLFDLHHDMVLIERFINRRDLPLTEGVVQRVIDRGQRDSQSRGSGAIDFQESPRGSQINRTVAMNCAASLGGPEQLIGSELRNNGALGRRTRRKT